MLSDTPHQKLSWFEDNDQIPLPEEANPYIDAFWKWWPDLVKTLMYLRVTGGEPLLSKSTFKILDWLLSNGAPELNLVVNSNLGIPKLVMNKYLQLAAKIVETGRVKSHLLHTSLDTWGEQAEYIRSGLDLEIFLSNLDDYMRAMPKSSLSLICTFSNLSLVGFQEFLEQILRLRETYNNKDRQIHLDIPHLQRPLHQSALILTPDYCDRMQSHIAFMEKHQGGRSGFKELEIIKMRRILQWMQNPKDPNWLITQRRNFFLFFSEHDRRRGTNFLRTFPEMAEFWHHCRRLAESTPHVGDFLTV